MTASLVNQTERQELYRQLAHWVTPSVPAIRERLDELGRSDLLENNVGALLVAMVAGMETMLVRAGLADEARSVGFFPTWDRYVAEHRLAGPLAAGQRWFPRADLNINVQRASSKVDGLSPDTKAAIDYLLSGMRANNEAVLSNRADVEVLDGAGKVVGRARRVRRS